MPDPETTWIEVSRDVERGTVQDHHLVLQAAGIPSAIAAWVGQSILLVRLEDLPRARAEIEKYARENREPPGAAEEAIPPLTRGVDAAIVFGGLLVLGFLFERRGSFGFDWWRAGIADAGLIRSGAWWRSVTALWLHADLLHLLGNLAFGGLFGVMLAQSVGPGVAWLCFIVTGGIGNWLNAWLQSPSHASIGASTAVFGMLGAQVAYDWVRRRHHRPGRLRRWAPLMMGLALLAWLGGGERHVDPGGLPKGLEEVSETIERIDVGAHLLGFLAGLALGALLGSGVTRLASRRSAQFATGALAAGLVAIAWIIALR